MTHDDALLRALKELDQPVDPSAAFTDRLQRQMHETADIRPTATASHPVAPVTISVPHEHPQWSRLSTFAGLAAAVLLIAIIGNLWTLTRDSGTPQTATVNAPATPAAELFAAEKPLMPGRSAANDGQIPGPAPSATPYDRLWKRSIPNMGFSALYGDALYYLSFEDGGPNRIVALDAATGNERWSRPLAGDSSFSLLPQGVVIGSAENLPDRQSFRVALLNHLTGAPIWTTVNVYSGPSEKLPPAVDFVLEGNTILFVDHGSAVVALDPATGQQRWRYDASASATAVGCDTCYPTTLVASDSMVYFNDILGNRLTALSLADGAKRWEATLASIRGNSQGSGPSSSVAPMQMTAVDQGVIVSNQAGYFGLLSAADGSTVWTWPPDKAIFSVVRVQSTVYVAMLHGLPDEAGAGFEWAEVEIETGNVLRSGTDDPNRYSNMAYLSDANLLIGGYRSGPAPSRWGSIPFIGGLFGGDKSDGSVAMDPTTLDVTWESSIDNCVINLPVAPDGKLLCNPAGGNYGDIAIYAPKP